jgi:ureidoglycolate lyase
MADFFDITVEPLTAEAFAPFGQIIGPTAGAPTYTAAHFNGWHLDYDVEDATAVLFIHYLHGPFEFDSIERHFGITQSFAPLAGAASVMVVAAPTDRATVPRPEDLRAFLVPGTAGIMLWKGTWHALTRFPVSPAGAGFAFLTGRETQRELERQQRDGTPPKLTEAVDIAARYGRRFRITDPEGLMPA